MSFEHALSMALEFICKVTAMINLGHLKYLTPFDKMEGYWRNLLKDYPDHPALGQEATSVPLTLYGSLPLLIEQLWTLVVSLYGRRHVEIINTIVI